MPESYVKSAMNTEGKPLVYLFSYILIFVLPVYFFLFPLPPYDSYFTPV